LAKGREGTAFTGKEDGTGHGVVLENYLIEKEKGRRMTIIKS
jgi:hypothetical protein